MTLPSSPRGGEPAEPATATRTLATTGSLESDRWARLHALERELHDGPALRIAALSLQLGVLRQKLPADDTRHTDIEELQSGLHTALQDLRRIADLIYPPLLHEAGLVAALRELAGRAPDRLRLTVAGEAAPRPDHAVEAALYFTVTDLLDRLDGGSLPLDVHLDLGDGTVLLDLHPVDGHRAGSLLEPVRRVGGTVHAAGSAAERITVTVPCA